MPDRRMQRREKCTVERNANIFFTGSEYRGTWGSFGQDGFGRYSFLPEKIAFEGEFRNGTCHGRGTVYWPRGQRLDGVWSMGKLTSGQYLFSDGLPFFEKSWNFCQFPDRRYYNELKEARSIISKQRRAPSIIPPDSYDTGRGIFEPRRGDISSYSATSALEIPNPACVQWIEKYCRKAWTEPTGHRPELYENWFAKGNTELASIVDLLAKPSVPETWWKRLTDLENCPSSSASGSDCRCNTSSRSSHSANYNNI